MSQDAKTLLYWVSNASSALSVDEGTFEYEYCLKCARSWANHIIQRGQS